MRRAKLPPCFRCGASAIDLPGGYVEHSKFVRTIAERNCSLRFGSGMTPDEWREIHSRDEPASAEPQWRDPVSDPPVNGRLVAIELRRNMTSVGFHDGESWRGVSGGCFPSSGVTGWMPLPEPRGAR